MATTISFNGASYSVPAYGDSNWAQGAGNISSYLIAVAAGTLQTTGGTFTLSAEAYFGATFGIKSAWFKTATATPSTVGVLRLAKSDSIGWRNNGGGADILLAKDSSDLLKWGTRFIVTSSSGATPTEYRETYTAGQAKSNYTGSLTLVNLVGTYAANGVNIKVFVNGLLTAVTVDYAETSTTSFTFTSSLNTGDRIDAYWTTY